jgi:hypothetical protein
VGAAPCAKGGLTDSTCRIPVQGKSLADGDGKAVYDFAGGWRAGAVRVRIGWRPLGAGDPGAGAQLSLVPRRSMGPELGQGVRLGLESLPRRARSGRPNWPGRLRPLGGRAAMGAAAATSTAMGAWRSGHVEPDRERLGILEQPNMDSDLTGCRISQTNARARPQRGKASGCSAQPRRPIAPKPALGANRPVSTASQPRPNNVRATTKCRPASNLQGCAARNVSFGKPTRS